MCCAPCSQIGFFQHPPTSCFHACSNGEDLVNQIESGNCPFLMRKPAEEGLTPVAGDLLDGIQASPYCRAARQERILRTDQLQLTNQPRLQADGRYVCDSARQPGYLMLRWPIRRQLDFAKGRTARWASTHPHRTSARAQEPKSLGTASRVQAALPRVEVVSSADLPPVLPFS